MNQERQVHPPQAYPMDPIRFYNTRDTAEKIATELEISGFCIVNGVLNKEQILRAWNYTWDDLEYMSPQLDRKRPSTWTQDKLPHDQRGMIQSMAGWSKSQMYVRNRVARLFSLIYGTSELDCSADGMTFSGLLKTRKANLVAKAHFDAGPTQTTRVIQGLVNLIDQNEGDACFGCYPKSDRYHSELAKDPYNTNWCKLSEEDHEFLRNKGLRYTRYPLKAGDVLLFYSQVAHSQCEPVKVTRELEGTPYIVPQKERMVHYVCMAPIDRDPVKRKKTLELKRKAYEENRATTHYPNHSAGKVRLFPKDLGKGPVGRYKRDISKFKKAPRVALEEMSVHTQRRMGLASYS